jgi:GntR family transcriptional regulator/MocR family aminotransferase
VIYIGTFSKVLFPSLRLGYIIVPTDLTSAFQSVRTAMDIGPPHFFQSVLADFIAEGHFSRHVRRMRVVYSERCQSMIDSIRNAFGFGADITGGHAGMHLAVTLKGVRDREIALRAADENLWLLPLSASYLERPLRHGFILGFGSTSTAEIPAAVRRLRSLISGSR